MSDTPSEDATPDSPLTSSPEVEEGDDSVVRDGTEVPVTDEGELSEAPESAPEDSESENVESPDTPSDE